MRDTGLADRLRAEGLKVIEVDGWKTRGSDTFHPRGSVNHHTAGPLKGNAPSLGVCINGRSDLPGPLCHVMLARDLTCYVIAAGRANHAGKGGWKGLAGNSNVYGLEVENTGLSNEPATPELLDAMHRVHAAFLRGIDNHDVGLVCQHEEWAPTRKIDFHDLAFEAFRNGVAARLASNPNQPEDDMPFTEAELRKIVGEEIDKRINPDGKGNLLVRIRRSVAATEQRVYDLVTGKRPGKD